MCMRTPPSHSIDIIYCAERVQEMINSFNFMRRIYIIVTEAYKRGADPSKKRGRKKREISSCVPPPQPWGPFRFSHSKLKVSENILPPSGRHQSLQRGSWENWQKPAKCKNSYQNELSWISAYNAQSREKNKISCVPSCPNPDSYWTFLFQG